MLVEIRSNFTLLIEMYILFWFLSMAGMILCYAENLKCLFQNIAEIRIASPHPKATSCFWGVFMPRQRIPMSVEVLKIIQIENQCKIFKIRYIAY